MTPTIKRYDEHPDGGGMREDELGAYVRFEDYANEIRILTVQEDRLRKFIMELQTALPTHPQTTR